MNKAFLPVAGRPLVAWALAAFRDCPEVGQIILATTPEDLEQARRLLQSSSSRSEAAIAGGTERQDSVAAALAEVSSTCNLVAIHDAARPLVTPELIQRCFTEAERSGTAVAALPATDTVKQADPGGSVTATLDRSCLWLVQTPQVFRRTLLQRAYEQAAHDGVTGTDDATLVERLGHSVRLVPGDRDNIKVTWPEDVARSEQVLTARRKKNVTRMTTRTGIGYDAHRFHEDRPLILGGVRIREQHGLLGHSDADALCHAISDALLGAIGAGDIGSHFPDSDDRYAGANSLALLAQVARLLRDSGWETAHVDAVVITEDPRLRPHVPAMRQALGDALGISAELISVKGKTTEGMGFTGRGEGLAVQAVATVQRVSGARRRRAS